MRADVDVKVRPGRERIEVNGIVLRELGDRAVECLDVAEHRGAVAGVVLGVQQEWYEVPEMP